MIQCAIAGFGWWGNYLSGRLAESDRMRVTTIVEPTPARAEAARAAGFTVTGSLEDALADDAIDAVILTTPNEFHEAQVLAAAAAGKHVFCEKPLGLSRASAARSVAACRKAGVVLGIGHERRFEPAMIEVRRLIESGELGTIMHVESNFSHDKLVNVPQGDWRRNPVSAPAAGMTGMGVHLTDLYISMFGRAASVAALTADRVLGWETGDVVTVQLGFAAGMTGTLSAILKTPHFVRYQVFGSDAWVELRSEPHKDAPGGAAELVLQRSGSKPLRKRYEMADIVRANLEAFAAAIAGEADYPYTDEQLVHNVELLEAIELSARTQTVVHLRPA